MESEKNLENQKEERFNRPYHFQCQHCGRCCSDKNTIVTLTYSDILRFHRKLRYNLSELLKVIGFYIYESELTEEQLKKMVIPPIQTQNGPAFVALRKNENGECIFLSDEKKCKIYHARPDICRTFPFHFHLISSDSKNAGAMKVEMGITEKAKEFCPGLGKPSPRIKPKDWMKIGKKTIKDIVAEKILIDKWNNAIEQKKITPKAENYLNIILQMDPYYNKTHYNNKIEEKKGKNKSNQNGIRNSKKGNDSLKKTKIGKKKKKQENKKEKSRKKAIIEEKLKRINKEKKEEETRK